MGRRNDEKSSAEEETSTPAGNGSFESDPIRFPVLRQADGFRKWFRSGKLCWCRNEKFGVALLWVPSGPISVSLMKNCKTAHFKHFMRDQVAKTFFALWHWFSQSLFLFLLKTFRWRKINHKAKRLLFSERFPGRETDSFDYWFALFSCHMALYAKCHRWRGYWRYCHDTWSNRHVGLIPPHLNRNDQTSHHFTPCHPACHPTLLGKRVKIYSAHFLLVTVLILQSIIIRTKHLFLLLCISSFYFKVIKWPALNVKERPCA